MPGFFGMMDGWMEGGREGGGVCILNIVYRLQYRMVLEAYLREPGTDCMHTSPLRSCVHAPTPPLSGPLPRSVCGRSGNQRW